MRRTVLTLLVLLSAATLSAQISPDEYRARREQIAKSIGNHAMLIVTSPAPAPRNGDVEYPFRQDDNLLYLTGITQADTTLVLLPGEKQYREILFVPEPNPRREVWTGRLMSFDEARKKSGISEVSGSSSFRQFLEAALRGGAFGESDVYGYYRGPSMPAFRESMRSGKAELWMPLANRGTRDELSREMTLVNDIVRRYPEVSIRNAQPLLVNMRAVKSPAEMTLVQRAIDITAEAQKAAMKRILTATNESQVQATIEYTFLDRGADGWGFPSIVASGANATTLHYESNHDAIDRGALLTSDIGAEVGGYSADVTRTYPADGTFSDAQRDIYSIVLEAQNAVLAAMKPGAKFADLDALAKDVVGRGLVRLGLTTKNELPQTRIYLMHGVGHPMGLAVHDLFDPERRLEPGMVVTDEPGIYVRRADVESSEFFHKLTDEEKKKVSAALDRYAGIGVRIEDDVLITSSGSKLLSGAAPRTIEEIEAWMK